MTHGSLTDEEKHAIGIYDNLIRLSIGLEYVQDLIDDLEQAFRASGAINKRRWTHNRIICLKNIYNYYQPNNERLICHE